MLKTTRFIVGVISVCLLATGAILPSAVRADDRPRIVATVYPLYELVSRIGEKQVSSTNLLPDDPFGEPTLAQLKMLKESDLVFALQEGEQKYLDAQVNSHPNVLRPLGEKSGRQAWQDTTVMAEAAKRVHLTLVRILPKHKDKFDIRLKKILRELAELDKTVGENLGVCNKATFHTTSHQLDRFASVRSLTPIMSPDLDTAIQSAQNDKSEMVYVDYSVGVRTASRIFKEKNVRIGVISSGAAQPDQARRGKVDYKAETTINVDTLRSGLQCRPKWMDR